MTKRLRRVSGNPWLIVVSIQVKQIKLNTGKAAEEFKKIGKFMIKAPVYKPKASVIEKVFVSRTNEEICEIKKN